MALKKEILYPIFLECCVFAVDNFWENIFEDLAYGKPPYGTYISKDFLCCGYQKKDFSYKIERKDPEQLYTEVYKLLSGKLGLLSPQEKISQQKKFDTYENSIRISRDSWTSIRKKSTKELFIELFVTRMKNEHSLSLKQSRHLLEVILMAMVFKTIESGHVNYSNGAIQSIDGITFSKGKINIAYDLYNLDITTVAELPTDKKLMSDNWTQYLKELKRSFE